MPTVGSPVNGRVGGEAADVTPLARMTSSAIRIVTITTATSMAVEDLVLGLPQEAQP
jgi:hypothetical protein